MKKLYYAFVAKDMVDYFEEKLTALKDHVEIILKEEDDFVYYVLKAEEGLIDPKWELKL